MENSQVRQAKVHGGLEGFYAPHAVARFTRSFTRVRWLVACPGESIVRSTSQLFHGVTLLAAVCMCPCLPSYVDETAQAERPAGLDSEEAEEDVGPFVCPEGLPNVTTLIKKSGNVAHVF